MKESQEYKLSTPSQSVLKSYLRQPVEREVLASFRKQLEILLSNLNPDDIEEANKGRVKTFLEHTLWPSVLYEINASGKTDLVIKDKGNDCNVILFEFKKVGSPEMVTKEDLFRKAMYELVLYYIIEERKNGNSLVKQLVISDGFQFFFFEKSLFWELFGKDNKFVMKVLSSENTPGEKRDYIYSQIISPKVHAVSGRLAFTYVDLRDFHDKIDSETILANSRFKALYKLFSPTHLLNLSFSEDHNTLNKRFYSELLYIMGLEERGVKHQIQRLREGDRQAYSLFEQAYSLLADYGFGDEKEGDSIDADRFEKAVGLIIVWVNRTLFMKLLESQLISFNKNKERYSFFGKIKDFAMMHYLFCKVMAIPEEERTEEMRDNFGDIPYLNSSLFELTPLEQAYFPISSLRNGKLNIMRNTCLKHPNGNVQTGALPVLDYLKQFLDSYDFGSEEGESGKTIINASVLGLIFEKINGYKDGAFFTPGYVSSYLCRNTLRRCVTDKYNERYNTSYESFDDLVCGFDYTDKEMCAQVDEMINDIRVCDPSVGSGHFLVSALNEFLAIKRELNVLKTIDGKRFFHRIEIEDDELVVTDSEGELRYNPNDKESQLVQESLFEQKRIIIENCLFGVDVNPNSAEICQLRLWIELLKNAYYKKDSNGKLRLQTLPNIDINIKCGNSIVMKYDVDAPIDKVLRGANVSMDDYRKHVTEYKGCRSKSNKHKVEQDIANIKKHLNEGYDKETMEYKKWVQVSAEILHKSNSLFPPVEAESKKLEELRRQESKLRKAVEEMSARHASLSAFEWRYEFPEVLGEKGEFVGFDFIIGNPPYGVSIQGQYRKTVEEKYEHMPDYEIYYYFISLAQKVLKDHGYMSYIIPNTWMFNVNSVDFRINIFNKWSIIEMLDCTSFSIFDQATVRNTVVTFQKTSNAVTYTAYKDSRNLSKETEGKKSMAKDFFQEITGRRQKTINNDILIKDFKQNWALALYLTDDEKRIVKTINGASLRIKDGFDVSQGYIPYRLSDLVKTYGEKEGRRIKDEQMWHADSSVDDSYFMEIKGENINKYSYSTSGVYVKYGKHVGTYVDMKYFNSRRLLVREIIKPVVACYVEDIFINDPGLINIIEGNNKTGYSLKALWGILNSKLSTFFLLHFAPKASKGVFPKILISDINNFPLPEINDVNHVFVDNISKCFDKLFVKVNVPTTDRQTLMSLDWQIDYWVFKLYGMSETDVNIIAPGFMSSKPEDVDTLL